MRSLIRRIRKAGRRKWKLDANFVFLPASPSFLYLYFSICLTDDRVEGLTKRFGTFTAVDHVSFSVGKGSIFGFLGPNGSGKSTVIRMLCGILEPTEGTARIGGHDVVRDANRSKK